VWRAIAKEWLRTTGEELEVSNPLVTVMGMRGLPREEAEKREAAWRLLHGVVLLQLSTVSYPPWSVRAWL